MRALYTDLVLIALVFAIAAALRLAMLGEIPYGLHPDEAQVGTDAQRILDGDPIGPYTEAALGQPSGHAYLATPFVWAIGNEIIALRLPLALVALAAVPLLYVFARLTLGRPEAFFASTLLATSYWHLLYSRVAHWSISYGTVLLAISVCIVLGLRRRSSGWLVGAGAILGAGVYTYNIYPIAVVAMTVAVAILSLTAVRREDRRWWWKSAGLASVAAFIVAIPMLIIVANPDSAYWDHFGNYADTGLLREDRFEQAPLGEKIELAAAQAKQFAATYTYDAAFDNVDGNGLRAVFDPMTLLLLAAGLVLALAKRRDNPAIIIALCCVVIIPLPAVLQRGSVMRQPVGAAPFAMLIAGLPLAWAWRRGGELADARGRALLGWVLRVGTVAIVAGIAAVTVRDYFWRWREARTTAFVYHAEVTSAARYIDALPDDAQIYFYSHRHPFRLETIAYVAPNADGINRSERWAVAYGGSIENIDRSRPAVFVMLDRYRDLLPELAARYPGGRSVASMRDGVLEFTAYELTANAGAEPITGP